MVMKKIILVLCVALVTACSPLALVKDRLSPPKKVEGGWLFQYDDPTAREVQLAGTFNEWNWGTQRRAITMQKNDQGIWQVVTPLDPGRYQYKIVVNHGERWECDPSNPSRDKEGGIENSLIVVQ